MLFYNIGVLFYYALIRIASLLNSKAKLWVRGRKNIFETISSTLARKIAPADQVIWMHCASLGEFEQGRPVLEKLSAKGFKIVLTFFSPSGYEIRKNYEHAAAVFYLPIDTRSNAERFIELVKPQAALFVKYEFWLNYLAVLREKKVNTYLVSGVFRPNQHFFKWYGKNFFHALKGFKVLFVQDDASLKLLQQHGLTNAAVAGDTRFDRVMEIVSEKRAFAEIDTFCAGKKIIVAGSTWPRDEELLLDCFEKLNVSKQYKLILVPHEVDEASMQQTVGRVRSKGFAFARYTEGNFAANDVLIIDTIGMLSQIYRYARVAYVGGGFNDGIHNILEVLAHGVPVSFGPNYYKFVEAREAETLGIGKPIHNASELLSFLSQMLTNDSDRSALANAISKYMSEKTGATEKICAVIN